MSAEIFDIGWKCRPASESRRLSFVPEAAGRPLLCYPNTA